MLNNHSGPGIFASLACAGMLFLITDSSWSLELQTVLDNTAITPPARVGFREERHNQLLKEPMVLSGYLEYPEAGWLRKVVETPFQEAFLVGPGQIEVERNGKIHKVALNKSKTLRTMLAGIEAILAGESEKLESVFRYELSGTEESWSLQLTPISRKIARHLTGLQVAGDDKAVSSIRFELKGGEWHLMQILKSEVEP
jgi:hypothetical protein